MIGRVDADSRGQGEWPQTRTGWRFKRRMRMHQRNGGAERPGRGWKSGGGSKRIEDEGVMMGKDRDGK